MISSKYLMFTRCEQKNMVRCEAQTGQNLTGGHGYLQNM
jgi:hypothetical protein